MAKTYTIKEFSSLWEAAAVAIKIAGAKEEVFQKISEKKLMYLARYVDAHPCYIMEVAVRNKIAKSHIGILLHTVIAYANKGISMASIGRFFDEMTREIRIKKIERMANKPYTEPFEKPAIWETQFYPHNYRIYPLKYSKYVDVAIKKIKRVGAGKIPIVLVPSFNVDGIETRNVDAAIIVFSRGNIRINPTSYIPVGRRD